MEKYISSQTESVTIERRSADATFHVGVVAAGADVAQVGVTQGRWNSDG